MGRRDDRPRSNTGNSIALWLILAGVGGILLLCGGVTAFGVYMLYGVGKAVQEARPTHAKRFTRDEFREMLMEKTKEEVIAAVGRPEYTTEPGSGHYWRYGNITYDPVSGKTDASAYVRFNSFNKVAAVDY